MALELGSPTKQVKYYQFDRHQIADDAKSWYNLCTARRIHSAHGSGLIFLTTPHIAGTLPLLIEFFRINRLNLTSELIAHFPTATVTDKKDAVHVESKVEVRSEVKIEVKIESRPEEPEQPWQAAAKAALARQSAVLQVIRPWCIIPVHAQRSMQGILRLAVENKDLLLNAYRSSPSHPEKEEKQSAQSSPTLEKKEVKTALTAADFSVSKVPINTLNSLNHFCFFALRTQARVLNIIDGDTFDFSFFVPWQALTTPYTLSHKTGASTVIVGDVDSNGGMLVTKRIRLYGADAAEHDKPGGPVATALITSIFNQCNNIIYIAAWHDDKYGRMLADIFVKPDYQESIVPALVSYRHPTIGEVYRSYFGGTKETFTSERSP